MQQFLVGMDPNVSKRSCLRSGAYAVDGGAGQFSLCFEESPAGSAELQLRAAHNISRLHAPSQNTSADRAWSHDVSLPLANIVGTSDPQTLVAAAGAGDPACAASR